MIYFFKKLLGIRQQGWLTKFSIGQSVFYEIKKGGRVIHSELLEVVDITWDKNHKALYKCLHQRTGATVDCTEDQLVGRKAA